MRLHSPQVVGAEEVRVTREAIRVTCRAQIAQSLALCRTTKVMCRDTEEALHRSWELLARVSRDPWSPRWAAP